MKKILGLLAFVLTLSLVIGFYFLYKNSSSVGDAHITRGLEANQNGNHVEAVTEFEKGIEMGVRKYELEKVYSILGNTYLDIELYEEAIIAHKKAIEINPDLYQAWVNLGIAYRYAGDLDKAEECYYTALKIEPDYPKLHASLGTLYLFKDEPEKAVEALEKAIELDPQLPTPYGNLSLAYAMLGHFEKADEALNQAKTLGYADWEEIEYRIILLQIAAAE